MSSAKQIERAIRGVTDQKSFIQDFLVDALDWPIEASATSIEDISYEWSKEDLRAEGIDERMVDGVAHQIVLSGNPWGIFILEFKNPEVFSTGRGMTGILRRILRGLVPKKRAIKDPKLRSFQRENILFICSHQYQHFRFAHFRSPRERCQTAPLAAFGWGPGDPIRTLCEHNVSALVWPNRLLDATAWVHTWSQAFSVEKVTRHFYEDYRRTFESMETIVRDSCDLCDDELHVFTQELFNRLMFLRFVERKGWLRFPGQQGTNYLAALYSAGGVGGKSFFRGRLLPLLFQGLGTPGRQTDRAYGEVPFLGGGLFSRGELDDRVADLPDIAFKEIIGLSEGDAESGLFYRYNFTVEESTPLDIEVAVDPEMLGKVFEELVTGRHESGSYYTPRPVVAFMCREALKGYLHDKTRLPEEALAALVDRHEVSERFAESQVMLVCEALSELKAVDPACGSGAYLLGLLQELVAVYRVLARVGRGAEHCSLFDLKLRVVSHNLHGVDKDSFATNIAMLRLWLSLAVEAEAPVPLPNLDFKIETGDSLLGPDPHAGADLFSSSLGSLAERLVALKERFLVALGHEKSQLAEEIRALEGEYFSSLRATRGKGVIDWRVHFAEVFAKHGGFHVVLANPPYVRNESIDKDDKRTLLAGYADSAVGKSDLYCYFYARGLQILAQGGLQVFICSNSWLDVGYGGALQRYLLENGHVMAIYDSAVERQFATADINTIISIVRRGAAPDSAPTRFISLRGPFDEAIQDEGKRRETVKTRGEIWDAGLRPSEKDGRLRYAGDKWGGRYLRAPDIFNTVIARCAGKLRPLGDFFEGERYLNTGGADGFFLVSDVSKGSRGLMHVSNDKVLSGGSGFDGEIESEYLVPLVKDYTKTTKCIEISGYDAYCLVVSGEPKTRVQSYIRWGEAQGYHKRSVTKTQRPWYKPTRQMLRGARILVPRSFNDSFVLFSNPNEYLSLRFYRLHPKRQADFGLIGFLNSSLLALFLETLGNKSLGQGVLDFFMADFLAMRVPIVRSPALSEAFSALKGRPQGTVWEEYGLTQGCLERRGAPRPDRKRLDDAVFDEVGLSAGERESVYGAITEMVEARIQKAGSLEEGVLDESEE